jgi:hypothetical protein
LTLPDELPGVPSSRRGSWLRSQAKRLFVWLVVALLAAAAVLVAFGGTPYAPGEDRLDAAREDPDLAVEQRDDGYVLQDADAAAGDERVGLVFYPGGRVEAAAYLWTLAPLVERTDVRVFVPEMPLHFAVFDPGAAAGVLEVNPGIERWYVGGHSLGGAMACRFAANNARQVEGVVLAASYCADGDSLDGTDLDVLAVWGSRDGVLDHDALEGFRKRAPADARFAELQGVNHSQFGAYGGQSGDRRATVSDRQARTRFVDVLVEWFGASEDLAG